MATGEETDHEELGGAEMHAAVSGVSDYLAEDERDAHPPGPRDRRPPRLAQAGPAPRRARSKRRATTPTSCSASPRPTSACPFDVARGDRPHRRRLALLRVQAALRLDAGVRLGPHPRLPGRHPGQQRHPVQRDRPTRARSSSSSATRSTCRCCSCRTSPASWSARSTSKRASSRTAPSSSTRSPTARPGHHHHDRRQLRRRQLRHVRPRLRAALPVHLAQPPHRGHGRGAAGRACSRSSSARPPKQGRARSTSSASRWARP